MSIGRVNTSLAASGVLARKARIRPHVACRFCSRDEQPRLIARAGDQGVGDAELPIGEFVLFLPVEPGDRATAWKVCLAIATGHL